MEKIQKKKLIIIGAGISGMTAGIYALENGYDVTIYEKHNVAGGQCTGWKRKGVFIDGCAHWIVGTNSQSDLYPLWRHVGAFDDTSIIYDTEYFAKFDIKGEIVTFYSDLKKLEMELLRVAPEDKRKIKSFINGIKAYQHVHIPVNKPLDKMNFLELTAFGVKMLPMAIRYLYYKSISNKDYSSRFKSNILKEVFQRIISTEYNIHTLFYIMQSLSKKDAGVVEGGSLRFAQNILETYLRKGGQIKYNTEIESILIENNTACGICLKNQQKIYSDFVISTADAHHTLYHLLQGKYEDNYYESRFNNKKDHPLIIAMMPSYKINTNVNHLPKMMNFKIPEIWIANTKIDNITVRNYSYDKTLNNHVTTFTVLVNVKDEVYDYFKSLSSTQYMKVKNEIAERIRKNICQYYHLSLKDVELLDIATPLTYERYTNAYKGAYMSFLTTQNSKGLMRKGLIKNLKNFVLAGQWIMPPGGLPIALFTGKHAVYRICNMDHKKFIDLDYLYKKERITNKATI